MAEVWPASLQDILDSDSFQLNMGDNLIRSETDSGIAKVRPRYTRSVDVYTASIRMSYSQWSTLETFYKTTLSFGSKTFNFDHPFTGSPAEWRFLSPPAIAPLGNGGLEYRVSLNWELLS